MSFEKSKSIFKQDPENSEDIEKTKEAIKIKENKRKLDMAEEAVESLEKFFSKAPEKDKKIIEENLEKIRKQRESQI